MKENLAPEIIAFDFLPLSCITAKVVNELRRERTGENERHGTLPNYISYYLYNRPEGNTFNFFYDNLTPIGLQSDLGVTSR